MKYIKTFETHSEYEAFTATTEFVRPNLSVCKDNNETHYNPWVETRLIATYTVEDESEDTLLYSYSDVGSGEEIFSKIEIDGVEVSIQDIDENDGYYSLTEGVHNVYYTLIDPTTIVDWLLAFCHSLTSIDIPNSVTSIGNGAFDSCSGLTNMTVDSSNTIYDSRNNCNAIIETSTNKLVNGCKNTVIPNTVTSIGERAFYNCRGLTSIDIPSGVTSIGQYAFDGCSFTSIDIPNSVTSIGMHAFSYCTALATCTFEKNSQLTSIGQYAFDGCSGLTSINIPSGVTTIDANTFDNCRGLTSINIPNSVTSIGNDAFLGCRSLTSIDIPSGVTSIGSGAFQYCSGLTSIDIPNNVTSINNYVFRSCGSLTSVTIGSGVTSIGTSAFTDCSSLTSIDIPNSVTTIGQNAFHNCSGITSINIPSGVTSISGNTFANCRSLTSINLPNSVTSIGGYAFAYCTSLTSIEIPSGVTSIGQNAFLGCRGLTSITSNATIAPTIDSTVFQTIASNGTLYVPIGSSGYDVWMRTSNYYLGKYNWTKVEQ